MRLRQLVLACGLTSFVLSPYASALGLGEVKLKSSLNQPLEAEVKLLDTRDLTAEQILVTLASPADFERNGVDRLYFYTELQFQVDLEAADGPKVIIKSRNPVREPYLNFLIEARWTAGRLLREYTLLMDLPTFEDDAPVSSVTAPAAVRSTVRPQSSSTATERGQQATSSTSAPRSNPSSTSASLTSSEYEVRANDTLWEIALRARPSNSVSVHQSMMALYRSNPEAFINGNINKLRRGQVLRIPDADEMTSVNKSEALGQFTQATGDSNYGAQLNASRRETGASTESAAVSGRVKLAAPSAGSNNSGQGSGANNGTGRALEGELAATLEELDKTKSENTELGSRVKDLEAQIETMERLVAVSNEKLRALQVAAGQEAASATDVEAKPSSAALSMASVASEEPAAVAAVASSAPSSVAAIKPTQAVAPKPQSVVKQVATEKSVFDSLKDNSLWLGLAVLGIFGAAAAAFAYRRRKQQEEELEEQDNLYSSDDTATDSDGYKPVDTDQIVDDFDQSPFEEDVGTTAVAETGDVVGEADIYIAYGKLDQAEEMLVNALEKEPDSADIRMKLLEVYAQQQNASSFDKHYALLLPIAGAALIARAADLRETIAGVGEFSGASDSASIEGFDGDFSLDDLNHVSLDLDAPASTDQTASSVVSDDELDFDFDLNLDDQDSSGTAFTNTNEVRSDTAVSDFDFDLSDFEDAPADASDELAELSSSLSQPVADVNVLDVSAPAGTAEEEFSFDFGDDLNLVETSPVSTTVAESLEVAGDDFNLDMNVDDVDLAALDHEMESLDVDFDDELTLGEEPAIADFAAKEIAKDEAEIGLDLDDDVFPLSAENELALMDDELDSSNLVLTDDLDKEDADELDLALLDAEGELTTDTEGDFELPATDLDFESLNSEFAALEEDAEISGNSEFSSDFANIIDLELDDEIPTTSSLNDDLQALSDVDEIDLGSPELDQPLELEQDEDLFAEALSDFEAESDGINLDAYSSDESALADLSDEEMDSELDFLADADEAATKLDLARAYMDMGDTEGAKDILSEVVNEGSEEQRNEANELLGRIV